MSCPYFYPLEPRSQTGVLPLGDLWAGQCRALPLSPCIPEQAALRPLCNLGYARGSCPRFPDSPAAPDAVRFTVSSHDASLLRIYYVIERDHSPFAHGPLEYSVSAGEFSAPPSDEVFHRQARAYVLSYLRRKGEPAAY